MAGHAKGEAGSRLVTLLVYDIHNMFNILHPSCLCIAMLIKSCSCSPPSYVTPPKYQKHELWLPGFARRRKIERPSQDVRRLTTAFCIMQCYIVAEKLYLPPSTEVSPESRCLAKAPTSTTISLSQRSKSHTNFRVARKVEAWRCHLATPPSFKTP